jgi:hypothetical protein
LSLIGLARFSRVSDVLARCPVASPALVMSVLACFSRGSTALPWGSLSPSALA